MLRCLSTLDCAADMFSMFSMGRPDCLPVGDLGVQKGFVLHFRLKVRITMHAALGRGGACQKHWRHVSNGLCCGTYTYQRKQAPVTPKGVDRFDQLGSSGPTSFKQFTRNDAGAAKARGDGEACGALAPLPLHWLLVHVAPLRGATVNQASGHCRGASKSLQLLRPA